MATKRLLIDANTGVMFIGSNTLTDDALTNPGAYLDSLNFHTSLPYVQFKQTILAGNLTFSAQSRTLVTWDDGKGGIFC